MLTIVQNDSAPDLDRLRVATSHLQAAIAHINNEAQRRVPVLPDDDRSVVEDLRLVVRALADIVTVVQEMRRHPASHLA